MACDFGFVVYVSRPLLCHHFAVISHPVLEACEMSKQNDKTELQRLMEEREATLACLAVCKAAQASVDQALQRISEGRQPNTPKDNKRVISSLPELTGTSARRSTRLSQPDKPCRTRSRVDGDTFNSSHHTNLTYRQRENQSSTKGYDQTGVKDGHGNSAEGLQGESPEDSFVMVESVDE